MNKPIALVTGGSRGIGRAIAEELARTHQVIATYKSNREAAVSLAEKTGAAIFPCQLGDKESRQELLRA
ncbi:MAG: SDR family NAD(P)-dependent oxidoreductase, partial [Bryobacteraceae bacterium]